MWESIAKVLKQHKLRTKIILPDYKSYDWSPWFTLPCKGYGEVKDFGPFKLCDLQQLLIDPVERQQTGRLAPDREVCHLDDVLSELRASGAGYMVAKNLVVIDKVK